MAKLDSRLAMVLLGFLLTGAPATAFPEPQSRAEAVAALGDGDAARRAEAVVWIANRGGMKDSLLLHGLLRDESALVRSYAEQGLWLLWSRSGDPKIDEQMAQAGETMQRGAYDEAIGLLSEVVRAKPDFAEGWNRRATAYYLSGQYDKSIADCDQVLRRNPLHFGALSGLGQIYTRLEKYDEALKWFRRALEVNPNMAGVEFNIEGIRRLLEERRQKSI